MEIKASTIAKVENPIERDAQKWEIAQSLESSFISEMLQSSGLGQASEDFSGGAGESQFSSFLTREYSNAMVKAGGIGLAEAIYNSMEK